MSRTVRKKHLDMIEMMTRATDITARLIVEGKVQECLFLLADCQDGAIALGSHIEKLHGLQTHTVGALEHYCECLYQFSVAIENGVQMDVAHQALKDAMTSIKEMYVEEFPDKKEVVFLPYNASMWDSLESVWMAARDDEACEAYVVPIPYYDLDAQGNFKEFHYEGDLYPDYVPITSYEEYDLEERHPDMIFIHNPYDECNAVTSVAPEFYSSRIKEFTEKLVYIPYFVLGEIKLDNEKAIESMSHFCFLPGTIYADEVIVQSEEMRQIYINEYMKAASAQGIKVKREELEKKFLGLGSPKLDKVANMKLGDFQIPKEWIRIIEKKDGVWKKIIFYNTSLGSMLRNHDAYLDKIEDVLRIFKENKNDVALLWRPHPLFMQTLDSMRPELKARYEEIVQRYKQEGWGIYDESVELDRAIVLSDAYYGDRSSVVQLCQQAGKPIMIQNIEIIRDK